MTSRSRFIQYLLGEAMQRDIFVEHGIPFNRPTKSCYVIRPGIFREFPAFVDQALAAFCDRFRGHADALYNTSIPRPV